MRYPHLPAVGSLPAPDLPYHASPNQSSRNGRVPRLVFNHVWGGGSFDGTVGWLCQTANERARVSSHIVYAGGFGPDAGRAVQLVPWAEKAWTECDLNPVGISMECADAIWQGHDPVGFAVSARMTALIIHLHGWQPRWVRGADLFGSSQGHTRHADAGSLGCGHGYCPTTDLDLYEQFHERVVAEFRYGKFRKKYGR